MLLPPTRQGVLLNFCLPRTTARSIVTLKKSSMYYTCPLLKSVFQFFRMLNLKNAYKIYYVGSDIGSLKYMCKNGQRNCFTFFAFQMH